MSTASFGSLFIATTVLVALVQILSADTLTWNGGANGTWDDTTQNWLTSGGGASAWVDGSDVKFATAAAVTVSGAKNIGKLYAAASSVSFSGDAFTFADKAAMLFNADGVLHFSNNVAFAGTVTQKIDTANQTFAAEQADVYLGTDSLLFSNKTLASITTLRGTVYSKFGTLAVKTFTLGTVKGDGDTGDGLYHYSNDGTTLTVQFQWKDYSYLQAIKLQLTQAGNDIHGQVLYGKYLYGSDYGVDADDMKSWSFGYFNGQGYDSVSGTEKASLQDLVITCGSVPTNVATEFAGMLTTTGRWDIVNGTATVDGTWSTDPAVYVANTAKLVIGENATVTFKSATAYSAATKVCGPLQIKGALTIGNDSYRIFEGGGKQEILPGGIMKLGTMYAYYGPLNANIYCYTNGTLELTNAGAIGCNNVNVHLVGGEMKATYDYTAAYGTYNFAHKLYLSNGAKVTGALLSLAPDYNNAADDITVTGDTPSSITVGRIRLGTYNKAASATKQMLSKFTVSNVTDDAASDLTVSSVFFTNVAVTCASAEYLGIEKYGAGTLELTGASPNFGGSVKVKEGTLKFGATGSVGNTELWLQGGTVDFGTTTGMEFPTLKLTSDSGIAFGPGGSVSFGDQSAAAWASDAVLTIEGTLGKNTLRFGTNANGLTAAQISQISYNGQQGKLQLSSDGYLREGPKGTMVLLQ
jgi:autotransporter-associated beta strand protein